MDKRVKTFHRLSKVIFELFEHPEFINAGVDRLREVFLENLSKEFEIAYDLGLDVGKLELYSKKQGSKVDIEEMGRFLVETLENEQTYILLNHFYYIFIQAYLDVVRDGQRESIEQIFVREGLVEDEIEKIMTDYDSLVEKRGRASAIASV